MTDMSHAAQCVSRSNALACHILPIGLEKLSPGAYKLPDRLPSDVNRRWLLPDVLANFAGRLVPDFQSPRPGLDLPSPVESSGTFGICERVNNDARLTVHFASATDESLRASPASRLLRKRDKCVQITFRHGCDAVWARKPSVSSTFLAMRGRNAPTPFRFCPIVTARASAGKTVVDRM
jgi:hypothetical protein